MYKYSIAMLMGFSFIAHAEGITVGEALKNHANLMNDPEIMKCIENGLKNPRPCAKIAFALFNDEKSILTGSFILNNMKSEFPAPSKEELLTWGEVTPLIDIFIDNPEQRDRNSHLKFMSDNINLLITKANMCQYVPFDNEECTTASTALKRAGNNYWFWWPWPTKAQEKLLKTAKRIDDRIEKINKLEQMREPR